VEINGGLKMLRDLNIGNKTDDGREEVTISIGKIKSDIACSPETLEELQDTFSYYTEGADYIRSSNMKKYQSLNRPKKVKEWAEWDGYFSVFYGTTFGTGILKDVIMWLLDNNYAIDIYDHRKFPWAKIKFEKDEDNWKTLYENQQVAFEKLKENAFTGIVWAATSFGKTVLGTHIMEHLYVPTVVLAQRRRITERWRDEIKTVFSNVVEEKLKGVRGYIYYVDDVPAIMVCTTT